MDSLLHIPGAFLIILFSFNLNSIRAVDVPFNQNFEILYGQDHTQLLDDDHEIRISINEHTGSGFHSKTKYGSGFFSMRVKLPKKDTTGLITTFYIISDNGNTRDEVDFEFLGNKKTPYVLHTNVIMDGNINRTQGIKLWFDPTAELHEYKILWNRHQVVLFVDDTPVRVFKNKEKIGVPYPTKPMHIVCTIWNATWASHGKPVNWSQGPFDALYHGFGVDGCPSESIDPEECYTSQYYWNEEQYWSLNSTQQDAYKNVRKNHMAYDYCRQNPQPPECLINS
ncbi:hypothetical protein FEM48_ZijujUnG0025300 [Ziziphus jujuba var. spinosa]|uniref:Xyloglucan endotransglucosylase/hydrolase n=1 Tax=Ziziphus jujuba var. spinosa TaxID=714518 RepID=A0A978U9R5_ZIZJJ|nr:hypothetical protein FEM48_ZijujUnG0025300 [Ziziphus jujuba var. spinosa]